MPESSEPLFYIRHSSGYNGDCVIWWRPNSASDMEALAIAKELFKDGREAAKWTVSVRGSWEATHSCTGTPASNSDLWRGDYVYVV